MARRKAFPLRINEDILQAMQGWADDELRSVNAQIEYVLRQSLRKAGRVKKPGEVSVIEIEDEQEKK
jgi:hypothetical protein